MEEQIHLFYIALSEQSIQNNYTQNKMVFQSNAECHRNVTWVEWDNGYWLVVKYSTKLPYKLWALGQMHSKANSVDPY